MAEISFTSKPDLLSVRLYSTDASVYEEIPAAVISPVNIEDCQRIIMQAREQKKGIIARGAGTSIAGQCVGNGIVLDMTQSFSQIIGPEAAGEEENYVWVEPGVVLDDLNDYLRPLGWQFPIDISTSSRCTIGGMIGNNAAGSHSIKYGTTREQVEEIKAILIDGTPVHFKPLDENELEQKLQLQTLEGDIYQKIVSIVDNNLEDIKQAYPDAAIIRRNTGYALDVLASGKPWCVDGVSFNLSKLICGSEGTLCIITGVRLRLSRLVKSKALVCVHFSSLDEAFAAVPEILKYEGIAAIELLDDKLLSAAKQQRSQEKNCDWIEGDPAAVLVCEFFAESDESAEAYVMNAVEQMRSHSFGEAWPVLLQDQSHKVWSLRKAGLGLLMGLRQGAKPVAVIEDSAVPVDKLVNFKRDIDVLMKDNNVECIFYGHASVGVLHLRPELDLNLQSGREKFRCLGESMVDIVNKYNGALSGEHGDGRLRAPFLRKFFGNKVYELNKQIKNIFDPHNIFNPGKIIGDKPIEVNLRQRPQICTSNEATGLDWSADGNFGLALERCNGTATCRQRTGRGAMCPTFQATGREIYSTRGRANILRMAFANANNTNGYQTDPLVQESMNSCLSCKACRTECPSGVDMAALKTEYVYRQKKTLLSRVLIANHEYLLRYTSKLPRLLRKSMNMLSRQKIIYTLFGLQRSLPQLAPVPYSKKTGILPDHINTEPRHKNDNTDAWRVLLLVDQFNNQLEPDVVKAAIQLLNRLGYNVVTYIMPVSIRLLVSSGFLAEAKESLIRLSDILFSFDARPIIGIEPAELLLLRDEAPKLIKDRWPVSLQKRCMLLDEFLLSEFDKDHISIPGGDCTLTHVAVHPHCHERAAQTQETTKTLLKKMLGINVQVLSSGCCGMGGDFGYRNVQLSQKIFNNNVNVQDCTEVIVAGTGCRHQFRSQSNLGVSYLAQFILDFLNN